jgi:uncharacterized protein (DUF1330 family)
VKDQEAFMKEFAIPGMKPIQEAGAKFLARGGKPISLVGASPAPRATIIQFDNMDKAQAWWNGFEMVERRSPNNAGPLHSANPSPECQRPAMDCSQSRRGEFLALCRTSSMRNVPM